MSKVGIGWSLGVRMDGEQDDDHEAFGEHEFTFDTESGHYLSGPRGPRGPRAPRSGWSILGQIVAVVLCLGGLAVVGYFVLIAIALSQWGSNK